MNRNHIKQLICTALNWQEADYQMYQFETGIQYLELKIGMADRVSAVSRTTTWWMWWQRQYDQIDRAFVTDLRLTPEIAEGLDAGLRYDLLKFYLEEHDPGTMQVYPSRVVTRLWKDEIKGKLKLKR